MCKFDEFEDVKSFASAIRWRDDRSYAIPEIFKFSSRIPVATIPEPKGNPNSRNPNEVRDYSSALESARAPLIEKTCKRMRKLN